MIVGINARVRGDDEWFDGHPEKPGVLRAIEVLRYGGGS